MFAVNAVTGESIWTSEIDGVEGGTGPSPARTGRIGGRGPLYVNGAIYSYHGDKLVATNAQSRHMALEVGSRLGHYDVTRHSRPTQVVLTYHGSDAE